MLKIQDADGKTKFVLRDEDEEPLSIDELILNDTTLSKVTTQSKKDLSNAS